MRSIESVRAEALARVRPLEFETVCYSDAVGRVVAAEVTSPEDVPSFDNSSMDGYAVKAADVSEPGAVLAVVGDLAAGQVNAKGIGPGEAIKIMTGAPIPRGADAVVRVEDTAEQDGKVTIDTKVPVGNYIRPAGGDMDKGQVVIDRGARLGPAHIGVLASLGIVEVTVSRRPRVAVLSTGDELRPPDQPDLGPGQIRDSNRPMLRALLGEAGAESIDLGRIDDDAGQLRAAIGRAVAESDVIVSSGGVSMGDYDVVKAVLGEELGIEFIQVAMSPGKPLGIGMISGRPFFGLPGNPVSVMVSFEQFVRPTLLAMQGATALLRPRVHGSAGTKITSDPIKEAYIRVRITNPDGPVVEPTGGQASNILSGAAAADAFAVLPIGVETVTEGEPVILELFHAMETRGVASG